MRVFCPGYLWYSVQFLTAQRMIPKCQFQWCLQQWQKCGIYCTNLKGIILKCMTTKNNRGMHVLHYWLGMGTLGYALVSRNKTKRCYSLRPGGRAISFYVKTTCFLEFICKVVTLERDELEMFYCSSTFVFCSHIWFTLVFNQTLHNVSFIISHLEFIFTVPLHYTQTSRHDNWIQLHMLRLLLCEVSHCCTALWIQSVNKCQNK